eukprot:g1377.t1
MLLSILTVAAVCYVVLNVYVYANEGRLDTWTHLGKSYRERLEAMYAEHNPEKLEETPRHIETLLRKYRWQMPQLFKRLRRKYNLTEYEL